MAEVYAIWLVTSILSGALAAAVASHSGRKNIWLYFLLGAALNFLILFGLQKIQKQRENY